MAASGPANGYQCQFIDSVPEDFYCKQCALVAKELTITNCCGESYCNACIQAVQQDNKPCPGCGKESFDTFPHVKYQRKILSFQVSCSLKERGCGWCGPLGHLDAHLHHDTGDCEYADIDCPLKCGKKIVKKTLDHHTAKECVQRDYICPYCAFKATYEIVTDIHWPECTYFPLACPNRCGVTCERPTMEDHLKICSLQEVECQFKHVGCEGKFRREEEEEHMREKIQTHLTMMATAAVKMNFDFEGKLLEQEKKIKEQERKSEEQERKIEEQEIKIEEQERKIEEQQIKSEEQERKIEEQERKSEEQERKIEEQERKSEKKIEEQKRKSEEQERKIEEQERKSEEQEKELQERLNGHQKQLLLQERELEKLKRMCGLQHKFTMENFGREKAKDKVNDWKSPPMYTHVCGYKFCFGVDANGRSALTRGSSISAQLWCMVGEYDAQLKWPAKVKFTMELINHFENGENKKATSTMTWNKPDETRQVGGFTTRPMYSAYCFIKHEELDHNPVQKTHFLVNDTLHFQLTEITLLS